MRCQGSGEAHQSRAILNRLVAAAAVAADPEAIAPHRGLVTMQNFRVLHENIVPGFPLAYLFKSYSQKEGWIMTVYGYARVSAIRT